MVQFYKYQGAGNDFILLDNRQASIVLSTEQIAFLCHRNLGIGADGLMLLEEAQGYDFKMKYYNADGQESTMCGNGGRCITAFARRLGLIKSQANFAAIDGVHSASFIQQDLVKLQMNDVAAIEHHSNYAILNTGSPHFVSWQENVAQIDVRNLGRDIRNEQRFAPKGINVNFVQQLEDCLFVRTFERGVEDETLSCGTGVTAAAIASSKNQTGFFKITVKTLGGDLFVSFTKTTENTAQDVFLTGPATFVFEGAIDL